MRKGISVRFVPLSGDNTSMNPSDAPLMSDQPILNVALQRIALVSLSALFLLCLLWEIWLAPLRPGGTLLFLKALPLTFALRGVSKGSLYTIQWASMLVLLYLMEGVVRVMSDPPGPSIGMAWIEIILSTIFFFSALFYVRPAKRFAKQLAAQAKLPSNKKVDASAFTQQSGDRS